LNYPYAPECGIDITKVDNMDGTYDLYNRYRKDGTININDEGKIKEWCLT
jgi:hypothetical protein